MKTKNIYTIQQEFYELPQIQFCEPSGTAVGCFGIRFEDKFGFSSQYVDLQENKLKIFIKFEGSEKVCWDCGGNRELVLTFDFDGNLINQKDLCDLPRIH